MRSRIIVGLSVVLLLLAGICSKGAHAQMRSGVVISDQDEDWSGPIEGYYPSGTPCDYGRPCEMPQQRGCGVYGRVEYLMWWLEGEKTPPLVTTSPQGTPQIEAGVLGEPGTAILAGGDELGSGRRDGVRFTIGKWLDSCQTCGIEANWIDLGGGDSDDHFAYGSDPSGMPILARPFFDASSGLQASELVAYPGVVAGIVAGKIDSDLNSGSVLLRKNVGRSYNSNTDLLVGYRYLRLRESLSVEEHLISINQGGLIPLDTTFDTLDQFRTESEFQGCQIGLSKSIDHFRWSIEGRAQVALGNMKNTVRVNGATIVTVPSTAPIVSPGGLLAQPTNMGTRSDNGFAAIPELSLDVRYHICCHWSLTAGYTFMLLDDVLRVAKQIDPAVNPTQIGGNPLIGDARPASKFVQSEAWLQGLNLGIECNW